MHIFPSEIMWSWEFSILVCKVSASRSIPRVPRCRWQNEVKRCIFVPGICLVPTLGCPLLAWTSGRFESIL